MRYLRNSKSFWKKNAFLIKGNLIKRIIRNSLKTSEGKADRERGWRSSEKSRFPEKGRSAQKCRSNWVSQRSSTGARETASRFDTRLFRTPEIRHFHCGIFFVKITSFWISKKPNFRLRYQKMKVFMHISSNTKMQ